jgi:hypothetical protein
MEVTFPESLKLLEVTRLAAKNILSINPSG